MCDYSLHNVASRPAKVGDQLTTRLFKSGTRGFCAPEDKSVAVCLLPGTELSFTEDVRRVRSWPWTSPSITHETCDLSTDQQRKPSNAPRCAGIPRWSDRSLDV